MLGALFALSFKGSGRELYEHIGAHILDLLLVASSYFRTKDPSRVDLDPRDRPGDAATLTGFPSPS